MTTNQSSCSLCENKKWARGPEPPNTWNRTSLQCLSNVPLFVTDMRRKAEVLQYKQNATKWTKARRFSYLSKNRIGNIKKNVTENQQERFNYGIFKPEPLSLNCKDYRGIHMLYTNNEGGILSHPSCSDVPVNKKNPHLKLYYNRNDPLTNWRSQRQFTNVNNKAITVNKILCKDTSYL